MGKTKVLVVEDEEDIRELIHFHLFKNGFEVILAASGTKALELLSQSKKPDLVLLDIMLPGVDGIRILKTLRDNHEYDSVPVIMLTAKGDEDDIVEGLKGGADDYIVKPFSPKILIARVKTILNRYSSKNKQESQEEEIIKFKDFKIDISRAKFYINEEEVVLTFSEFHIMKLFLKNPGRVFARSQIVEKVRGQNHAITDRSVDVHVVFLRRKLGISSNMIESVRGIGYRFSEE